MPAVPLPASFHGLFGHRCDSLTVDVFHREDVHVRVAHRHFFALVEIADADEHRVGRKRLWREAADVRQIGRFRTQEGRERHAVHVAAHRGRRRVHVAMRVDPYQTDRQLACFSCPVGGRRHRSGGKAVVAAEHKWDCAVVQTARSHVVQLLADLRDVVNVLLPLVAQFLCFRDRRREMIRASDAVSTQQRPVIDV